MSNEASTTEGQTPQQPPQGNFDDKGRFVRVKGAKYSKATLALIARFNDLVDNLALFGDAAVVKHLLYRADISDKPSAVQNLVAGLRQALDAILEDSKKNDREAAEAALTALRTQLTEEHTVALSALNAQHEQECIETDKSYVASLSVKDAQLGMYHRLGVYQGDVYDTINSFVRLLSGRELGVGIHPQGPDRLLGDTVRRRFVVMEDFLFTVVTSAPSAIGELTDYVNVSTARGSKMPKLVSTTLQVRADVGNPGLSIDGRQTLENILRRTTRSWFKDVAPKLTDDELSRTFRDPVAARQFFGERAQNKESGFGLASLLGFGQGHGEHTGDESCPTCNAILDAITGGFNDEIPDGFSLVTLDPSGPRLVTGANLGNWGGSRNHRRGDSASYGHDFDKE
ncbi:MAG TPA: hypothetical protein VJ843_01195 [Candidatus Saccharimonadales bacterium]|nr:hypothetical protein [Candidatus Saccharimonadales bacterium]